MSWAPRLAAASVAAGLGLALLGLDGEARPGAERVAPAPAPALRAPAPGCDRRLQSAAFLVTDGAGRSLAESSADVRRPVGSLVKLMTAELVLRRGGLDQAVTVPPLTLAADESRAGLRAGQRLSRRDLLRALLVPSGNDAAETLASAGRAAFVRAMNRSARRLGLRRTRYANPSGMPAPGQRSTARDVVRLARRLMGDARFEAIVRSRAVRVGGATLRTRNPLLGRVRGVDGIKTGTLAGNFSLVVSSRAAGGGRVYVAVLGAPTAAARDHDAHCLLGIGGRLSARR